MAPSLTHLVAGARVWAKLDGAITEAHDGAEAYGTFLFGCLAPDVDKLTPDLEQATALVDLFELMEDAQGLERGSLKLELMIETPRRNGRAASTTA